jgi:hypothetical protein
MGADLSDLEKGTIEPSPRRLRRDPDDGSDIIPGAHDQSHIYEWSDTELAVMFITPATKPARPFYWRKQRDTGLAAGMRLIQNGARFNHPATGV